jgi:hypothetical protein
MDYGYVERSLEEVEREYRREEEERHRRTRRTICPCCRPLGKKLFVGMTPEIQIASLEQIRTCYSCGFCQFLAGLVAVEQRSSNHHPSFNFGGTNIVNNDMVTFRYYGPLPNSDNQYSPTYSYAKDLEPALHVSYEVFVGNDLAAYLFFYKDTLEGRDYMTQMWSTDLENKKSTQSWSTIEEMRAADRKQLEPETLRGWLRQCEGSHDQCSIVYPYTRLEIYLIDLKHSSIIEASTEHRYIALSYVLGGRPGLQLTHPSKDELLQPGSLNNSNHFSAISQAVKDATVLAASAKEHFLWVDSMCIVQDDQQSIHQQIAAMDQIYSQAVLTVVALSGHHADIPLPGVRAGSRTHFNPVAYFHQRSIKHLAYRHRGEPIAYNWADLSLGVRAYSPEFEQLLTSSKYETRGWCLQERVLSRRCLYLTNWQAYFQCSSGTEPEYRDLTI